MLNEDTLVAEPDAAEWDASSIVPVENWPEHWRTTRLADESLFSVENGTWTGEKEPLVECSVIRNTNFTADGRLDLSDVAQILVEHRQLQKKRLAWGDIIIERSGGGPKQPVGRVAFFDVPDGTYSFSNFTSRVRVVAENEVDARFLHLFLHYFHLSGQTERLQRRTTGIRNLAFADYKNSDIPLPPLPEQHAIARILCTVQDAIQARQHELELERERKAALMQHLFTHGTRGEPTKQTEIDEMPESWQVVRLEDIAARGIKHAIVDGPFGSSLKQSDYLSKGVPIVRIKNVSKDGRFVNEDFLYISEAKYEELRRSAIQRDDILVTRVGTIGNVCIYPGTYSKALLSTTGVCKVSLDKNVAHVPFIYHFMLTKTYRRQLEADSSASVQKYISLNTLKRSWLPLPSIHEQRNIAEVLNASDAMTSTLEREISLLDELFRAVLEELMTGRLSALPLVEAEVAAATGVSA